MSKHLDDPYATNSPAANAKDAATLRPRDTSLPAVPEEVTATGSYAPPGETAWAVTAARSSSAMPDGQREAPTVPGFEILEELGRGGMGVVYRARQVALDRVVALKMILTGAHAHARDLNRFRAEAKAVARFQHPNIVQIHEVGEVNGLPYFSLEFVAGGNLSKKIDRDPQPPLYAAH